MARRSAEETRRLLLEEGLTQLQARGVLTGIEHISLESVYIATGVPRSSSHSAWSIDEALTPQVAFQRQLLQLWLESREDMLFAIAARDAILDLYDRRGGKVSMSDIVRCGIQGSIQASIASSDPNRDNGFLSTDMAIKHSLASQAAADRDPDIVEWVRKAEFKNRQLRIEDTYRPLAALLNYRPRPEYGDAAFDHIALGVACLVEGIVLRHLVMPDDDFANAPIAEAGPDEEPATLIGVCVEGLVQMFFEPIPDESD